jgi:hypothetical protein
MMAKTNNGRNKQRQKRTTAKKATARQATARAEADPLRG